MRHRRQLCIAIKLKGGNSNDEKKKAFEVIFKFSDVVDTIEAENEEEAERLADEKLKSDCNPQNNTYCYGIEIEEIED